MIKSRERGERANRRQGGVRSFQSEMRRKEDEDRAGCTTLYNQNSISYRINASTNDNTRTRKPH